MVSNDVNAIALTKVCHKSIADRLLYASAEAQIMISWQTRKHSDVILHIICGICLSRALSPPIREKYPAETIEFLLPEIIAKAPPSGIRTFATRRCPFSSPIEQVTQENYVVGIEIALYAGISSSYISVGVRECQRVERPWTTDICVRIYKLRVCDKDEMVRCCSLGLHIARVSFNTRQNDLAALTQSSQYLQSQCSILVSKILVSPRCSAATQRMINRVPRVSTCLLTLLLKIRQPSAGLSFAYHANVCNRTALSSA